MEVESRPRDHSTADRCPYLRPSAGGTHVCLAREHDLMVISARYVEAVCVMAEHANCSLYRRAGGRSPARAHHADHDAASEVEMQSDGELVERVRVGEGTPVQVEAEADSRAREDVSRKEPATLHVEPRDGQADQGASAAALNATSSDQRAGSKDMVTPIETQPVRASRQRPERVEVETLDPAHTSSGSAEAAEPPSPAAEILQWQDGDWEHGTKRCCPRCGSIQIHRRTLRMGLRPLRLIGIDARAYECDLCEKRFLGIGHSGSTLSAE